MRAGRGRWVGAARPRALLAAVLALLAGACVACDTNIPGVPAAAHIPPPTAAESLAQALADLSESGALHVQGALTTPSGEKAVLDVRLARTGEAKGTFTLDGRPAELLVIDKVPYVKGSPEFWASMSGIPGIIDADRWAMLPPSQLGFDVNSLFRPAALAATLGKGAGQARGGTLEQGERVTVAGVETIKLDTEAGSLYLAAAAPHRLVRAQLVTVALNGITVRDVDVTLTDTTANQAALYTELAESGAALAEPTDPYTTVRQGTHHFDACGPESCAIVVELTNTKKAPVRVSVTAKWSGDGKPLGTCVGTAGPVGPGQTASATCAITAAEWAAFYSRAHSVGGEHPYSAEWSAIALADPPDVRSLKAHAAAAATPAELGKQGGYYLYSIDFAAPDGTQQVWKYGVAPGGNWRDHAAEQLRGCVGSAQSACTFSLVTAADDPASAYAAQHNLIDTYRAASGRCPPAQAVDCPV